MILLEHEAKQLLEESNIPIPSSELLSPGSIPAFLPVVLKSQVPIGGRGKQGGIRIISKENELQGVLTELFKHSIKGFLPHSVLAEEVISIDREYYLSLRIDRQTATISLLAHREGGIDIEAHDKSQFFTQPIDTTSSDRVGAALAEYLELEDKTFLIQELCANLTACFIDNDATLLEINPLILTSGGVLVAGDCKMELDDAATFRHSDWSFTNRHSGGNFVALNHHGTVATIANGAGLAMATVDAVAARDFLPANFLDIGGGASKESVLAAFRQIMEFPDVSAIVINIFAGITRCDEVARAIIAARSDIESLPPLFIRLSGTNYQEAVGLLQDEGITTLPTLEACLDAVEEMLR